MVHNICITNFFGPCTYFYLYGFLLTLFPLRTVYIPMLFRVSNLILTFQTN